MALIGIINAAPSLLTIHTTTCHFLLHSRSPSEELLKIKNALCKKRDPPLTDIIITTFYQKVQTCFYPSVSPLRMCLMLHPSLFPWVFQQGEKRRTRERERVQKTRGKKARLSSVNWSECTTKSGFTTKVSRSDCQYCQRNGVLGRGGSKRGGDTKVRWGRQEGLL